MESGERTLREFFKVLTPQWLTARLLPFEAELRRRVSDFVMAHAGQLILDIGAGEFRYGAPTVAVDCRPEVLTGPRGPSVQADAEELPFESGSAEAIIASASLCHFRNPSRALEEMFRCAKTGCELFVSVPDEFPWTGQPDDRHRFNRADILRLIEGAGWHVLHCEAMGGRYWVASRRALERVFNWNRGPSLLLFGLSLPAMTVFPIACYYLDSASKNASRTLGWAIVARRPETGSL